MPDARLALWINYMWRPGAKYVIWLWLRRFMLCLQGDSAQKMLRLFICDHFYHSHICNEYLTTMSRLVLLNESSTCNLNWEKNSLTWPVLAWFLSTSPLTCDLTWNQKTDMLLDLNWKKLTCTQLWLVHVWISGVAKSPSQSVIIIKNTFQLKLYGGLKILV